MKIIIFVFLSITLVLCDEGCKSLDAPRVTLRCIILKDLLNLVISDQEKVQVLFLVGMSDVKPFPEISLNRTLLLRFKSLEELYVTGTTPILDLNVYTITGNLDSLRILNLTANKDTAIKPITGTSSDPFFPNLVKLVIEDSGLRDFPAKAFLLFRNIEQLSLANNNVFISDISSFQNVDVKLSRLRHLNISHNSNVVPSSVFPTWFFPQLEILDASGTNLQKFDRNNQPQRNPLKMIFLRSCNLMNMQEIYFNDFQNLSILDLSDNQINTMKANQFEGLTLQKLNLSKNKMSTIDPEVFTGSKIVELDLSNQSLNLGPTSPNALSPLKDSLRVLNLSNNVEFNKDKNFLQFTCNIFSNLEILRLRNTGLRNLYDTIVVAFPRLQVLDLSANPLTVFPNNLTEKIWRTTTLKRIYLDDDELKDSCLNSYFIHWLGKNSVHKPNGSELFCRTLTGLPKCPIFKLADGSSMSISEMTPNFNSSCSVPMHDENGTVGLKSVWISAFTMLLTSLVCSRMQ